MLQPNRNEDVIPILVAIFLILIIMTIVSVFVKMADAKEWVMNTENQLIKELKKEEGFRSDPYMDTTGNWTIGYGHNLYGRSFDDNEIDRLFPGHVNVPVTPLQYVKYWQNTPLTQEKAEFILEQDILIVKHVALKIYKRQWLEFNANQKVAILDLIFNLGEVKYRKFRRHIKATKELDWERSAKEVLNSKAARELPERYNRLAKLLSGDGEFNDKATAQVQGTRTK